MAYLNIGEAVLATATLILKRIAAGTGFVISSVMLRTNSILHCVGLAMACWLASLNAAQGEDAWPAFPVAWRDNVSSLADVSFLLQAPAGQGEFVRVQDGHLVYPDGSRFRIWGLNATASGALPPTNSAVPIAAGLARRGIKRPAALAPVPIVA